MGWLKGQTKQRAKIYEGEDGRWLIETEDGVVWADDFDTEEEATICVA